MIRCAVEGEVGGEAKGSKGEEGRTKEEEKGNRQLMER